MSGTIFAKATVYIGPTNKLLTKETSVEITRSTGSQPVHTTHEGYAGESPGSAMSEITCSNAVPAAGFEMDAGDYMEDMIPAVIRIFGPNKHVDVDAFIYTDTFKHSVDSPSNYEFKARGKYAPWT